MHRSFPRWIALLACAACSAQPASEATLAPDVATAADVAQGDVATQVDTAPELDTAAAAEVSEPDLIAPDIGSGATDAEVVADVEPDTAVADDVAVDAGVDSGPDAKTCKPGAQMCQGALLATCAPKGDGYTVSKCFPGSACIGTACKPVSNNLIMIFDTSGSMTATVNKKDGTPLCKSGYNTWPKCEDPALFPDGCSRLGVSKAVFNKALAKLDDQVTHMSLFRFPQTGGQCGVSCSCTSGGYSGDSTIKGDGNAQMVVDSSSWFWNNVNQIMCVAFPKASGEQTKAAIGKWMDNVQDAANPELRATGGTPIGKSLFYIGEYIRNKVVVDGKACKVDDDCGNANYACDLSACKDATCQGACKDAARSCRDTIVILFTDGGETSSNSYFGPWIQAKRMAMGLGCATDADCVGDASCQKISECVGGGTQLGSGVLCNPGNGNADCVDEKSGMKTCATFQQCMPKAQASNYQCSEGATACLPTCVGGATGGCVQAPKPGEDPSPAYCSGQCTRDPRLRLTATATESKNNVLRSPDGKPFAVRLYVVDIGSVSADDVKNSMSLAISGGGKLLGADASDPVQFLGALEKAFDLKNKNVCGVEL